MLFGNKKTINISVVLISLLFLILPAIGVAELSLNTIDEIDEFDNTLYYHSFPTVDPEVQTIYNPQWSISLFTPEEDFIMQGLRVLVEEYEDPVFSATIYIYEFNQTLMPGDLVSIYTGEVEREVYQDNIVWLELHLPVEYQHVLQADEPFWISIGTPDTDNWAIMQDTNDMAGYSLAASGANGNPQNAVSSGDWIMEAGGTYAWPTCDVEASQLWNTEGLYHMEPESLIRYVTRITNVGGTPSMGGTAEIEITDEDLNTIHSSILNIPPMVVGAMRQFEFQNPWVPSTPGRYTVSVTINIDSDDNPLNDSVSLYQQVIGEDNYHGFDDGTAEALYSLPEGQGLAVMLTPALQMVKSARVKVYFDHLYSSVNLSAYRYENAIFTRIWEYNGPVQQGWVTFALASPLLNDGAVAFVFEDGGNNQVSMDISDPQIEPNDFMPFTYFLTDGAIWNPDPDIPGKPLVQVAYELSTGSQFITADIEPLTEPVVIEPGDSWEYTTLIENTLQEIQTLDIWTELIWPTGEQFSPLQLLDNQTFIPGVPYEIPLSSQDVPFAAPDGIYQFRLNVGQYPDVTATFDAFNVLVDDNNMSSEEVESESTLPQAIAVSMPSPNPFNSATTLTITMAYPMHLAIDLYDVIGRHVGQLIDENFATGQIPITIDGTMLASGTYFVRIHSDENTQAVMRKITLLK